MALTPLYITSENSGLIKNKKPFKILNNAFQELFNAYVFRERVKKREGIKLVGRLRRCYDTPVTLSTQANGASYLNADILADASINVRATETNANIEPGSLEITVGALTFVEAATPNGTLSAGGNNVGVINYNTGQLNLTFDPALGGATNVDVTFCYFPTLPSMGIDLRELAAINVEQSVFFDTKYVYSYNGSVFDVASTTVWAGADDNFFWMENYRGSDPQNRLFFVTNFTNPNSNINNRIRHTDDLLNWTDFTPPISGDLITNENMGVAAGAAFAGVIMNTPVIPGSVTIRVQNGVDPNISFRDQLTTYPNGDLIGSPSTNSGTIDYQTGAVNLSFSPALTANADVTVTYQYETSYLWMTKLIVAYYGRLLFLNTFEGPADPGDPTLPLGAVNFFNRVRFSQVGNPIQRDAWISSVPGKGGFIDAPTNEAIVSCQFYKNTLIVFFEKTTWQLRYVGEYGLPFIWERISSDFGSESTFSTVLFDKGVLAVGDKAIIASSGNDAIRIDLDIPDEVYNFHNQQSGKERVHGARDFFKEVVFWCYSDGGLRRKFPNRSLVYNYRNNTWAIFRDNITCFGQLTSPNGISWDTPTPWDAEISWDTLFQGETPLIVSGNQQGYIHFYQYPDTEVVADSSITTIEHQSLFVKDITRSNTENLILTVPNHNLETGDIIFLIGALFVNVPLNIALSTTINNKFYRVVQLTDGGGAYDVDRFQITQWDFASSSYIKTSFNQIGYLPAPGTGTYVGGGEIALYPQMRIETKDFNPLEDKGLMMLSAYTDFMTDASANMAIFVQMFINSSAGAQGNLLTGNTQSETSLNQFGIITDIDNTNPCVITSPNHCLLNGREITIRLVTGTTQLNGGFFTITFIDANTFSLNGVDATGFGIYAGGGQWLAQDYKYYTEASQYAWHRFYASVYGQYITYLLGYNDEQMNSRQTHEGGFELNAMRIWIRQGGKNIF